MTIWLATLGSWFPKAAFLSCRCCHCRARFSPRASNACTCSSSRTRSRRSAFVYLACILDAFSRRCVGWYLSREITTQLTRSALHQAIVERRPKPGLIHHSDRGVQYASREYVEQLQEIGAQISMS